MTSIIDLYENLKSVQLRTTIPKIVQETSKEITVLNRSQLKEGKTSDGVKIKTKYKSPSYAKLKHDENPLPGYGVPDLKLTGAFTDHIKVAVKGKFYEVDSANEKSDRLEKKYGKEIFGLTNENKSEYATGPLFKGIKSHIEDKTGLKFR